jgi:Sulfatase-modifying factor enzyme 1
MHGNVWEWCSDWYGEKLSGGTDPVGPGRGSDRVGRGCCWRGGPDLCRSADHFDDHPSYRNNILGFRVARSPLAQQLSRNSSEGTEGIGGCRIWTMPERERKKGGVSH